MAGAKGVWLTLALVVFVGLAAGSCAKDTPTEQGATNNTIAADINKEKSAGPPKPGGQLAFGLAADTSSFNPFIGQWAGSAYLVGNAIYDPLAALDEKGDVHPYLAESFTPNADFTEWKIKLRPGISFHNGEKLDSAALKTTLEFARKSGLTAAAFTPVAAIEQVDDLTVAVKMSTPWSTFPEGLILQAGYVAAPEMLNSPDGANADPIGTGPFIFVDRVRDASLKVRKNPNYWQKDKPLLDGIDFRIITDTSGRGNALEAGDLDAMEVATPDTLLKYQAAAKDGKFQIITDAGQETDETVIALNTTKEPFDDPLARQALAYGLNQDELSEISYSGAFPGAWGNFEQNSPYYISKEEAGYPEYNPEKARQLVSEYEQKHGKPISFTALIPTDPQYVAIAQALQQKGTSFGLQIQLSSIEQTKLITQVLGGDYQAAGFQMWSAPTLDKGYFFIATPPATEGLSLNYTRFSDPEITAAMNEARTTTDKTKQIDAYKTVQKRMAQNLDKIFLVHNRGAIVFGNQVHGFSNSTFPDTQNRAFAPSIIDPFYTAVWKEQQG